MQINIDDEVKRELIKRRRGNETVSQIIRRELDKTATKNFDLNVIIDAIGVAVARNNPPAKIAVDSDLWCMLRCEPEIMNQDLTGERQPTFSGIQVQESVALNNLAVRFMILDSNNQMIVT